MGFKLSKSFGWSLARNVNPSGGASRYAPYPAPPGFKWDFVTIASRRVTVSSRPIVILKVA